MSDEVSWEEAAQFADIVERSRGSDPSVPLAERPSTSSSIVRNHAVGKEAPDGVGNSSNFDSFIFPRSDDYATRDYQRNIVTNALTKNTLVVLPTGLGKTFIAAVVMYNYLRWFPEGKVIFMAPTRPLVNQQIQACHDVVGIDERETAEMNGQISADKREKLWRDKRVFYCTPQTAEKDLESGIMPKNQISLIVVDEAHRAVGRYAFVNVVQNVFASNKRFRVLALSATPGKDYAKVQEVVTNLLISSIEYKSESDIDVKPYVFQKMMDVVECQMNNRCLALVTEFNKFVEVPLRRLKASDLCPMLPGSAKELSSFQLVTMLNSLGVGGGGMTLNQVNAVRADLGLLTSLVHVRTLMVTHGISASVNHLRTHFEGDLKGPKRSLVMSQEWRAFLAKLHEALRLGGANPKISKLKEILTEHFERYREAEKTTSVIVFTQFRDSVAEIVQDLRVSTPLRVSPFVGQAKSKTPDSENNNSKALFNRSSSSGGPAVLPSLSSLLGSGGAGGAGGAGASVATNGQTQKEQQEVVRKFRAGELDVLVATCIGEEGLDIGSVDLIVSYDALQSPVRMIQRFGRAGRKRAGRIIVLVADEKEKQMLMNGTRMSSSVHRLLRENAWKIKLFKPPPDACMFPNPNLRPRIDFRQLDISEYRGENVGGHSHKKKRRKDVIGEPREALESRTEPLDIHESKYLSSRFGNRLHSPLSDMFDAYAATENVPSPLWRGVSRTYVSGTSQRSDLMKKMSQFSTLELWKDDPVFASWLEPSRIRSVPAVSNDSTLSAIANDPDFEGLLPQISFRNSSYVRNAEGLDVALKAKSNEDVSSTKGVAKVSVDEAKEESDTAALSINQPEPVGRDELEGLLAVGRVSKPDELVVVGADDAAVEEVIRTTEERIEDNDDDDVPVPPDESEWTCSQVADESPKIITVQTTLENPSNAVSLPNALQDSQTPVLARQVRGGPAAAEQIPWTVSSEEMSVSRPRQKKRLVLSVGTVAGENDDDTPKILRRGGKQNNRQVLPLIQDDQPLFSSDDDDGERRLDGDEERKVKRCKKTKNNRSMLKRVKDTYFVHQAEVDDVDSNDEDDQDGSEMDGDLSSFIDDATQDEMDTSAGPRMQFLVKESPMEKIWLKPGRSLDLAAMPVIAKALQNAQHRRDQGLSPDVEEDEDDDEEEEEEDDDVLDEEEEAEIMVYSSYSTQDSPSEILKKRGKQENLVKLSSRSHGLVESLSVKQPLSNSVNARLKSERQDTSTNIAPGSTRVGPISTSVGLDKSAASQQPTIPPSLTVMQSNLSDEVRRRIEENRLRALARLQQKVTGGIVATTGAMIQQPLNQGTVSSVGSSTLLTLNQQPRPRMQPLEFTVKTTNEALPPDAVPKALVVPSTASVSNPEIVSNIFCWSDGISTCPSLEILKHEGLFNLLSSRGVCIRKTPAFRSFGADLVLSFRLAARVFLPSDLLNIDCASTSSSSTALARAEGSLNRILQRYAEAVAIVMMELKSTEGKGGSITGLTKEDPRVEVFVHRLRLWRSAGVKVFVVRDVAEVASLVATLAMKEQREGRMVTTEIAEVMIDPQKRKVVEFLSQARECNSLIAGAMVAHFRSKTLAELIDAISKELLCSTITPGLPPAQATKIAVFFKRVWKPEALPNLLLGSSVSTISNPLRHGTSIDRRFGVLN